MNSQSDPYKLLEEALDLHKEGKLSEAEKIYRRVLESDPRESYALHLLGLVAAQNGKAVEAAQLLQKSLEINSQSAICWCDLGIVCHGLEQFDSSVAAFRRALSLQPNFPEALCQWGDLYQDFCFLDKAIQCFERALSQSPNFPDALKGIEGIRNTRTNLSAFLELLRSNASPKLGCSPNPQDSLKLERRELLPLVLNELGLRGAGAEIGVKEGNFSERILRRWEGGRLYSIDPWREFLSSDYADIANEPQEEQDRLYRSTIRRLMPFQRRSLIWRLTSKEGSELISDQSLDFCYIDADHSYEGVSEDLRLWFPKVRNGGVLAGHDYVSDGDYWFGKFGVQRAVNEFAVASKLDVFFCEDAKGGFLSWVAVKR